jgi:rubrerythrin
MSENTDVCLTFDAACMAGIEMENRIFENYVQALRVVKDQAAKEILLEAAQSKLIYKHRLEAAVLEGKFNGLVTSGPVSVMNLKVRCCDQGQIDAGADARKALAFAMQMAQDALRFYRDMAKSCEGAPMAKLFTELGDDQTRHLQQLEDTFEEHFLPEG